MAGTVAFTRDWFMSELALFSKAFDPLSRADDVAELESRLSRLEQQLEANKDHFHDDEIDAIRASLAELRAQRHRWEQHV
ncbi:MAG: hypothetical protein HY699_04025 [Deltaproteobacteria bacterium]|nr:hypothetical protein [Deltaproteobacteria bacterium]